MHNDGELCDVTIIVQSQEFRCHKVVLAAFSKSFQSLFSAFSGKPGLSGNVNVRLDSKIITASAFAHLLDYLYTCHIQLTKENAAEVQHAAKFLNIKGVAEACAELLQNSETMTGHHTTGDEKTDALASGSENSMRIPASTNNNNAAKVLNVNKVAVTCTEMLQNSETMTGCHTTKTEKTDALASGPENSTRTPVSANSYDAAKLLNIKEVAEACTEILQNSETMTGCHTTETGETDALASGLENSTKTPVSTSSDDVAHKKESSQGSTTCEVTHEEDDMIKAVDSSQHASQHIAKADTENEKNSTCEKASCTPLSKTFVSKNTMQGSPLDDSNVSDCGNVEAKDEAELPILSQWLETHDVDKKTATNEEAFPSEAKPKEVSEEDLNQLLLEKLETELGGIPTIEDLDEDPIVWDPMGWIQDDPDCLEGERSEVRSKASSGAHCDDDEGLRRKRKLSGEMFPGTKRSKMDVQTASAHTSSDDISDDCVKQKDPVLYSVLKDKFHVTELQTPKLQSVHDKHMKLPGSKCSTTLSGRDKSRNDDCGNVVQQLASKTSKNKALQTKTDSSPANLHPFSMSDNMLAEGRKPCYPLLTKDPERYKCPSNLSSTDQQGTFFRDYAAIRDTSQQSAVPVNIPTNTELRGVCEKKGTRAVPHSKNAQFKTGIVDKPKGVLSSFGKRVVARDLFSTKPSVPQSHNLQFKTVHDPSMFTGCGERVVHQDLHCPTVPHSQNIQFKTINNPGNMDKPTSISPSFGERVIAQDLCIRKPTVPHSQNVEFKTIHNNPSDVDKPSRVLLSFGERVVARDLFSTKPTVPQLQSVQFKTAHDPIVDQPGSIFTGYQGRVVTQDLHISNPTMPRSQNLQFETLHRPSYNPRKVSPPFGERVVTQDLCVSKPTVPHLQNMQFKTFHNPGTVDKQRSISPSFGERVVTQDLSKPTVPHSQFQTVQNPGIGDKPRSVFKSGRQTIVARDIYATKPTVTHNQNVQFKTIHNSGIMDEPRSVFKSMGDRVVARDIW